MTPFVRAIRQRGYTAKEVAARWNITPRAISRIASHPRQRDWDALAGLPVKIKSWKNVSVKFIEKGQNWQDEITTYWFSLAGTDIDTGCELGGIYGVADCNGEETIIDCDGSPMTPGDWKTIAVKKYAVVTDELRLK